MQSSIALGGVFVAIVDFLLWKNKQHLTAKRCGLAALIGFGAWYSVNALIIVVIAMIYSIFKGSCSGRDRSDNNSDGFFCGGSSGDW